MYDAADVLRQFASGTRADSSVDWLGTESYDCIEPDSSRLSFSLVPPSICHPIRPLLVIFTGFAQFLRLTDIK